VVVVVCCGWLHRTIHPKCHAHTPRRVTCARATNPQIHMKPTQPNPTSLPPALPPARTHLHAARHAHGRPQVLVIVRELLLDAGGAGVDAREAVVHQEHFAAGPALVGCVCVCVLGADGGWVVSRPPGALRSGPSPGGFGDNNGVWCVCVCV
jgi:hypothetical protein